MWIKLAESIKGLFFPSETLQAGAVLSIGDPKGRKLVAEGKAVQTVFPGSSGDPDDVAAMRERYRKANGGGPLWDERRQVTPASPPQAGAATARHDAGLNLDARVQQLLGPRSAKNFRRQLEARATRVQPVTASKVAAAAKRLAAGCAVTTR